MQHPTPEQLEQIASLGRLRMPREACGMLARGELLELPNRAPEDCTDRAVISADDIPADLTVDEVLFWHTHPGGNVGPSGSDLDLKRQMPDLQYLVVTLVKDGTYIATRF